MRGESEGCVHGRAWLGNGRWGAARPLTPAPQEGRTHRTLPGLLASPLPGALEIPPLKSPRQAFRASADRDLPLIVRAASSLGGAILVGASGHSGPAQDPLHSRFRLSPDPAPC